MAAILYQETRMKLIQGGWTKEASYPVIDGFRAMSADEIFALVERINNAGGNDVKNVVRKIEVEVMQIAEGATGKRVHPS
jgi:hypothetical protein